MTEAAKTSNRILLVDDESSVRLTFRYALQAGCREVVECSGGREALEKVEETDYDLIVLDHQMPDLTGTEVLQEIRERGMKTPVIVVTAYGSTDVIEESQRLGCSGFLHKPVTPEELRTAATKALNEAS